MATNVTGAETEFGKPEVSHVKRPPKPSPQGQPHRFRFLFVYAILAAALGAAVAGVVVYAGRSISPGPTWSAWKPHGGGLGAAQEIAAKVAATYHLPSGDQLVDVIAKEPSVSPPSSGTIPIHYLAIRGAKGKQDTILPVSSSDTVMYSLCGLGTACSIAKGKPSTARGTLVRREILELSLYTFKYAKGIKNVIAFMPPRTGAPQYIIVLQRNDVKAELKVPLAKTLSPKVPFPATIKPREARTIDQVTDPRVFQFSQLAQSQQGEWLLVLSPLPA